jgi:hypothetical protein
MDDADGWRPLSEEERAIVELICRLPANNAFKHLENLDSYEVRQSPICVGHCPTIEFRTSPRWDSSGIRPMPGGATGNNRSDGVPFNVSLFEREGHLELLEFTPYGDGPLTYLPSVDELEFR